jgi:hypothetical protein
MKRNLVTTLDLSQPQLHLSRASKRPQWILEVFLDGAHSLVELLAARNPGICCHGWLKCGHNRQPVVQVETSNFCADDFRPLTACTR